MAGKQYAEDSGSLYEAYLEATKQKYGSFVEHLPQGTDDLIRFRNNILPKEYPPVIYATVINDETVQLSCATIA